MKTTIGPFSAIGNRTARGMTLIELTVVILVLLSLVVILFVGARAWKRGSDRVGCMIQIRQTQVAVRSYANINGHVAGDDVSPVNLQNEVIGTDKFIELTPTCPSTGLYTFGGNIIPDLGVLYLTCSLATTYRHEPEDYTGW